MPMDFKQFFTSSISQASDVVRQVSPKDYDNETPAKEWSLIQLLNHMLYELAWASDLIAGRTIKQVGSRYERHLLKEPLIVTWRQYKSQAEIAMEHAYAQDSVHLSHGIVTLKDYASELASDQLIHAWDVGESIHRSVLFDHTVAEAALAIATERRDHMRRSGLFKHPVIMPNTAPLQERLLAAYGRKYDWR